MPVNLANWNIKLFWYMHTLFGDSFSAILVLVQ